jgi:hypothetical protein
MCVFGRPELGCQIGRPELGPRIGTKLRVPNELFIKVSVWGSWVVMCHNGSVIGRPELGVHSVSFCVIWCHLVSFVGFASVSVQFGAQNCSFGVKTAVLGPFL